MASKKPEKQLFIKSVGYGVMLADLVAPDDDPPPRNGAVAERARMLDVLVRGSGIMVQEILPDPEDPSKAVLILPEGHAPGKLEKNQTQEEDWERLSRTLDSSGSRRLAERLDWIRGAL